MVEDTDNYGPEWLFLETLCRHFARLEGVEPACRLMAKSGFSIGRLLEHATRHKLQFLIAHLLSHPPLLAGVPLKWRALLRLMVAANRERNRVLRTEAACLAQAMSGAGIRMAARKGILLDGSVYGSAGLRWMNDIDFMVFPEDKSEIIRLVMQNGYKEGVFDYILKSIAPHDRSYLLKYRLHPDHFPRYTKVFEAGIIDHIGLDLATHFTWWDSGITLSLEEAFAGAGIMEGSGLPGFSPEYHLLDVILHLFRHAFFESNIERGSDVTLSAFLDVLLLCDRHRDSLNDGRFAHLAVRHGVEDQVAWVLGHLRGLFGPEAGGDLGFDGTVSAEFLGSWRKSGGGIGHWQGSMRKRLYVAEPAAVLQQ